MEFLNLLCNLYMIGLTAVLALYTGGTYSGLGDTKYILFRNLSALCLCLWLAASVPEGMRSRKVKAASKGGGTADRPGKRKISATDICVLLYGAAVLLSALLSRYETTAWLGYVEWYMGAVSQLMFVGIYFFISRCYDGKRYSVFLWVFSFFLVVVLGILHRFGIDPLGLMNGAATGDWAYSHMLSTIGNINWFCGYCGVSLALPVAVCLKSGSAWKRVLMYVVSEAGLFLLFVQGSDTGVAMTAICLAAGLFWGIWDGAVFRRTFALAAGVCFLIPGYGLLASRLGEKVIAALPPDSIGWNVINLPVWWLMGVLCLAVWGLLYGFSRRGHDAVQKRVRACAVGVFGLILAAGIVIFLVRRPGDEMWGSGRGVLWRTALQGFSRNGWLQKLIGVGPDCFAEYIYSTFSGQDILSAEGRWAGAVYANAHNEWLNHLVNLGIMGTGCYLGIFVSGIIRYRRYLPGVLALTLYGAASLTCFQQCMSTPFLFLMLGLCEASRRAGEQSFLWRRAAVRQEECEFVSASQSLQASERQDDSYEVGEI